MHLQRLARNSLPSALRYSISPYSQLQLYTEVHVHGVDSEHLLETQ